MTTRRARIARRLGAALFVAGLTSAWSAEPVATVRLYALDCGQADVSDMASFADSGEYDGKTGRLVVPCFVIRHPKGTLLWDAGLGDALADRPDGLVDGPFHLRMPVRLVDQLKAIGLAPDDVDFISFSHLHFDHVGNANLFRNRTTWLIDGKELSGATSTPPAFDTDLASFDAYKTAKLTPFTGDFDVFGDGSVRILAAPGHTPGHKVLLIKLRRTGAVLLSGDLYHTVENRRQKRVPTFNTSRAETLASFDRIERIVKNMHARFVVQHAPESFAALPKFPAYLD